MPGLLWFSDQPLSISLSILGSFEDVPLFEAGHLHSLPLQLHILVWPGHVVGKILNDETENNLTVPLFLKVQKSRHILIIY